MSIEKAGRFDVNPKVWTKKLINIFGFEFGIVPDSFLLVLERFSHTISLKEQITTEPETILDDEQKNDYTSFDGLISKMKLTAVEHETLSILMTGFTMSQIGKILNVNRTTIRRRQNSIRKKIFANKISIIKAIGKSLMVKIMLYLNVHKKK